MKGYLVQREKAPGLGFVFEDADVACFLNILSMYM